MKKVLLTLFACLIAFVVVSQQNPIVIAELTIKIRGLGSEELFYGFAEGDRIIFDFEEINGKTLKEIKISENSENSKFMDYKISKIENKEIVVLQKSVYKFKIYNASLRNRICKIKIQRIPKSEDFVRFNTNWRWETKYDTLYTIYTQDSIAGYDTTYINKTRKELASIDTVATELFSKTERVHSETAIGKTQYAYINVPLPQNQYYPTIFNPYQTTEVIAWSYWIGVGGKALAEYEKANRNFAQGISTIGALTGYGALASLAATGISMFSTPTLGDNVQYKFLTTLNGATYTFDSGNGIAASGRNTQLLQGYFTIQLYNDNFMEGIDVTVKIACLQVKKTWKDIPHTKEVIKPRTVKVTKKKMTVKSRQVRVNAE